MVSLESVSDKKKRRLEPDLLQNVFYDRFYTTSMAQQQVRGRCDLFRLRLLQIGLGHLFKSRNTKLKGRRLLLRL